MNDTTLKKVDGDGTELKDVVVDGVASSSSAVEPASGVGGSVSSRSNVETRDEASGTRYVMVVLMVVSLIACQRHLLIRELLN